MKIVIEIDNEDVEFINGLFSDAIVQACTSKMDHMVDYQDRQSDPMYQHMIDYYDEKLTIYQKFQKNTRVE